MVHAPFAVGVGFWDSLLVEFLGESFSFISVIEIHDEVVVVAVAGFFWTKEVLDDVAGVQVEVTVAVDEPVTKLDGA
ncbi:MAG: hypothetical protein CMF19_03930 [Idiomarinaceae bacterium]|nr:hypothetical protein [Idiomarinaceae bacterium]